MNKIKHWKNLLENNCPKCGSKLFYKRDSELWECALYDEEPTSFFGCDFSISIHKIESLKQKIKQNKFFTTLEVNTLRDHRDWNNYKVNR